MLNYFFYSKVVESNVVSIWKRNCDKATRNGGIRTRHKSKRCIESNDFFNKISMKSINVAAWLGLA